MALSDRFRLLSPFNVEREIHGEKFRYYANSVRVAARMASLIAKLAGHFSVLLGSTEKDQPKLLEDYVSPDGEKMSKTQFEAINPDLAKLRTDQRSAAVEGAIKALLDEGNRLALCEMLVDSLRDDFPRTGDRAGAAKELSEQLDIPTFIEHLRGLAEANARVFGDLGNALRRAVREKAADLLGAAAPSESPSPSASPETHG